MYGASRIGLTLTQPLWDGFATRSRVRTGEATVDSMTYRVLDNATSFALDALIAHVDLLRRREILELARANVAQHEKILASEEERVQNGRGDQRGGFSDAGPLGPCHGHSDGCGSFAA